MSLRRLRARVPSATPLGSALLPGHRLAFHKAGRDGSAKCDIVASDERQVHGVLYRMHRIHRPALDDAEGLGRGYDLRTVQLSGPDDVRVRAFTYVATHIDPGLRPYRWYVEHVLRGAHEHGLPADYIASIATIVAIDDPDRVRSRTELAIYN